MEHMVQRGDRFGPGVDRRPRELHDEAIADVKDVGVPAVRFEALMFVKKVSVNFWVFMDMVPMRGGSLTGIRVCWAGKAKKRLRQKAEGTLPKE